MSRMLALALATVVAAACGPQPLSSEPATVEPGAAWGPLAVAMSGTGAKALIGGTLEITDTCVFLTRDGEGDLIIWSAAQTAWDEASRTIVFRNRDGAIHRLVAGQQVSLGGGGFSQGEDGRPPGEFLAGIDWANPPRPECVTPVIWSVGEVEAP